MSARRFRAASRLAVAATAAMVIGLCPGVASAQSVNVGEELKEVREPEEPALNVHPWQWLRRRWLDEVATLDRLVGLQAGISFTTIYQHAAGLPSEQCPAAPGPELRRGVRAAFPPGALIPRGLAGRPMRGRLSALGPGRRVLDSENRDREAQMAGPEGMVRAWDV